MEGCCRGSVQQASSSLSPEEADPEEVDNRSVEINPLITARRTNLQKIGDLGLDKAGIEADHVHALDPGGGHELELLAQPREARRRRFACEEFPRMRLEGQDAGSDAQLAGLEPGLAGVAPDDHGSGREPHRYVGRGGRGHRADPLADRAPHGPARRSRPWFEHPGQARTGILRVF